jgi:DNA-binding XRE family transcriptional regulator
MKVRGFMKKIPFRANGYFSLWTYSPQECHPYAMESGELQTLGHRIRERRKALNLTQEELAAKADIDRSYIGGVERGERNVTFTMLCTICAAIECDVAALTYGLPELPR